MALILTIHLSGVMALKKGAFTVAKECFRESLEIARDKENAYGRAISCQGLGRIALEEKHFFKAERRIAKALEIFKRPSCTHGKAVAYHQLGILAREQGKLGYSADLLTQSLKTTMESIKNGSSGRAETRRPWESFVDLIDTYNIFPKSANDFGPSSRRVKHKVGQPIVFGPLRNAEDGSKDTRDWGS